MVVIGNLVGEVEFFHNHKLLESVPWLRVSAKGLFSLFLRERGLLTMEDVICLDCIAACNLTPENEGYFT